MHEPREKKEKKGLEHGLEPSGGYKKQNDNLNESTRYKRSNSKGLFSSAVPSSNEIRGLTDLIRTGRIIKPSIPKGHPCTKETLQSR